MKSTTIPRFKPAAGSTFFHELKQSVEEYFTQNNKSKFANGQMVSKTVILLLAYYGSYSLLLALPMPAWAQILLCILMGLAMAGIGMGVMHDANHGSYSQHSGINRMLGKTADLLGVSSSNWTNQHNKLHHTFTNIYEHDEDIYGNGLFRFSKEAPRTGLHAFQHLYWVFFYGLLTLSWFFLDLADYGRYRKRGLNRAKGKKMVREVGEIIFFKLLYVSYMILIPILVMDAAWWQVIVGFVIIHFVAGTVLAVVFQLAHVVDVLDPDSATGELEEWAVHQVHNTVNFATGNRLIGWYCGGLNFQVEHHLFPNICHVHYPSLNKIIQRTAIKHGVKYREFGSFGQALRSHLRLLRSLGKRQVAVA